MMLSELIDTCNRIGIRLGINPAGLSVDAPTGTLTPEIRQALTEHKPTLLAALAPIETDTKPEDVSFPDDPVDPIFPALTHWLHRVANQCQGETITDQQGRSWDVLGTASEFLLADWSEEWLDRISPFYSAVVKAKPEWGNARKPTP